MARPRLNIEQNIITAMHNAARHGYPVVHVWQIQMWIDVECCDSTIKNNLKRLIEQGAVKKYHYRAFTLPDRKSLQQKIQALHRDIRTTNKAEIAACAGTTITTVAKYIA